MGTPSSTPPNSLPECILVSQGNKPLQGLLGKCFWGGAHDAFCLWCFWGAPVPKPPSEVWQHIPLELLLCFSHLCCRWSQGIFQVPSLPDHATILTPIFFSRQRSPHFLPSLTRTAPCLVRIQEQVFTLGPTKARRKPG